MRSAKRLLFTLILGVTAVIGSAWFSGKPASADVPNDKSNPGETPPVEEAPGVPVKSPDEVFAELADKLPGGFGGFYVEPETGVARVFLKDTSQFQAFQSSVAELQSEEAAFDFAQFSGVEVLQARYDFRELYDWRKLANEKVFVPGLAVSTSDISDTDNVIVIGVADEETEKKVLSLLTDAGIPQDAVRVESGVQVTSTATVRDKYQTLSGGLQISYFDSVGVENLCTLGFYSVRQGVTGFVTASHCSYARSSNNSSPFYHNVYSSAGNHNRIGQETVDPGWHSTTRCPGTGYGCRYSDALFAQLDNPGMINQGFIARANQDSIVWDGNYLRITSYATPSYVGQPLGYVGRTSGRRSGTVQALCVDTVVPQTPPLVTAFYECQYRGDFSQEVQGGDSGAPVFSPPDSILDVTLNGLMHAREDTYQNGQLISSRSVFSSIGYIINSEELGWMTVTAPGGGK